MGFIKLNNIEVGVPVSAPNVLLGRLTTGAGEQEEIEPTVLTEETAPAAGDFLPIWTGDGLRKVDFSELGGGGGSGTVTSASVVTANGLAGTVATATTTPAITISTTVTGILKGNGTAISAAVNSDLPAMSATVGGAVPTPPNNTTTFLRGDGTFAAPAAGGETVISPASFATDQNDWNPTSLSTATWIRLTTSVNLLLVTGITAPASGKELKITNIGSNTILLSTNDPSSSAANRFSFGRDIPIYPGKTVLIAYDLTSALWRLVDKTDRGGNLRESIYAHTLGGTTSAPVGVTFASIGGVSHSAPTATKPAGVLLSHGTSLYGVGSVNIGSTSNYVTYASASSRTGIVYEAIIVTPSALSDATNEYYLRCGANVNPAVEPQGFYFLYHHGTNSGKWLCQCKGGSTANFDSGVTVAASTAYRLTIVARPDNTVAFFINESYVGETTTGFPTQPLIADVYLIKYAGSSARSVEVQYIEITQVR